MKTSVAAALGVAVAMVLGGGVLVAQAGKDTKDDGHQAGPPTPVTPSTTPKVVTLRKHAKGPALLPDLRIKALDECGAGDVQHANEHQGKDCFWIAHKGRTRMLKFAAITVNVGKGPMEVWSTRSEVPAAPESSWTALVTAQRIYHDANRDGIYERDNFTETRSTADFYWEHLQSGEDDHGHTHWHILDFDSYSIVGQGVATMEKRGFCFEDNTTYDPWYDDKVNHPEVPRGKPRQNVFGQMADPGVYVGADFDGTACGYRRPEATTIVHGLSVGYADTYPSSLPDQGIDITSLPDKGTFTVRVVADADHLLEEEVEDNNSASARVTIDGDKVTKVSAAGGL